jgi:hypothetical protein
MGVDAGKPLGQIIVRYLLVGAGLGLYFGYFFRPVRDANMVLALALAVIATIVTTAVRWFRGHRPPLARFLRETGGLFLQFGVFLLILEGRHLAFNWGGRIVVVLFTTLLGTLTGLLMAVSQSRASAK